MPNRGAGFTPPTRRVHHFVKVVVGATSVATRPICGMQFVRRAARYFWRSSSMLPQGRAHPATQRGCTDSCGITALLQACTPRPKYPSTVVPARPICSYHIGKGAVHARWTSLSSIPWPHLSLLRQSKLGARLLRIWNVSNVRSTPKVAKRAMLHFCQSCSRPLALSAPMVPNSAINSPPVFAATQMLKTSHKISNTNFLSSCK